MIQQRFRIAAAAHLFGDLAATALAFFGAWALRFESRSRTDHQGHPGARPISRPAVLRLTLFPVVFYFHGLYRRRLYRAGWTRRSRCCWPSSWPRFCSPASSPGIARRSPPGASSPFTYSRAFLALFATLELVLGRHPPGRDPLACCAAPACTPANRQRILVIGAGELGIDITEKLQRPSRLRHRGRGLPRRRPRQAHGRLLRRCRCSATTADLEARSSRPGTVDQVFVALPLEAHKKMMQVLPDGRQRVRRGQARPRHPAVRHDQGDPRGARRHAGHQPLAGAAAGLAQPRQARARPRVLRGRAARPAAVLPASSRWSSGSRTAVRSSTARSAWASTAARS